MPRLSRFQLLQHARPLITQYFRNLNSRVLTTSKLTAILEENRRQWLLAAVTTTNDFLKFLVKNNILEELKLELPNRYNTIDRYSLFGNATPYELALSINRNSYISHYSALYLHGLTNNVPKHIYTNLEQRKKFEYDDEEMEQKNIDYAFSRPMRQTNQIAELINGNNITKVYLLNGKNLDRLGVILYDLDGFNIPITSMERTLIDAVVRPNYVGGVDEVLNAFSIAKGQISVNRLLALLKKMKYKYPYHQAIGFYLEKAGYKEEILKLVENMGLKYNFYLTYGMKQKSFSERWKIYYPKGI
ncbi:hypothetical protein ABEX29_27005 [Brevibacillus porteri]|uniref:type IV toxin-antitoxin system AbiEi family antitoxin domain-containing protein n=1 Tax=Brevibacillus porteri TaxID=2126350 RepID=UPI003D1EF6CF